jgi:hypothetical protein
MIRNIMIYKLGTASKYLIFIKSLYIIKLFQVIDYECFIKISTKNLF